MPANMEIRRATALEVAQEFGLLNPHSAAWKPRTDEPDVAEDRSEFVPELIAHQDLH